jgi:hypothetical protein
MISLVDSSRTLLANSCPAVPIAIWSTSVYKARSINALIHPGMQYYDYDICSAVLPQNKNGDPNPYQSEEVYINGSANGKALLNTANNSFALYPNPVPANGKLMLDYHIQDNCTVIIYDLIGKPILSMPIYSNAKQATISIGNLASGLYKVSIVQDYKTLQTFKINVE